MDPTAAAPNQTDWSDLTQECLINILSRLTLKDRWCGPMFTCKTWHAACKDASLHSTFDLEPLFHSSPDSPRFWTPDFVRRIDSMLVSVISWSDGSVSEIQTRHSSDRSLLFASQRCPNLEVLSIKSSPNVTDASISQIAFKCMKLRELDISYCYEVSHDSLSLIGRNCPNLRILKRNLMNWLDPSEHVGIVPKDYLDACPQDGDLEAVVIAKNMPCLERLELRFSKLRMKGLTSICEGCMRLEYLDLYGCANLTSRDIVTATSSLESLKEIKKSDFYIPRSAQREERYGHWRLYDERFQTDVYRI